MARDHHVPDSGLPDRALDRLIGDLGLTGAKAAYAARTPTPIPPWNHLSLEARKAADDVLVVANLVDEAFEALPYEHTSFEQIVLELRAMGRDGFIDAITVEHLNPPATSGDLTRAMDRLPVFPAVALEVLRALRGEDTDLARIERLASRDQVLAASLLRVANSALYAAGREARTLTGAIVRLGTEMAAQVVISASLKQLFASASMSGLWQHSLKAAAVSAQLATRAGTIAQPEAAVLGLVHDIGRLVIQTLPEQHSAAHTRIAAESGCPVLADFLVCGCDHGQVGADLLARWDFPDEFIEAVRHHHQPKLTESRLASVLYLAEYVTGSDEDIPSISRLSHALIATGDSVSECLEVGDPHRLETLLDAA